MPDPLLPESVNEAILRLVEAVADDEACELEAIEREKDLRRAIAAALLRAEADGADWTIMGKSCKRLRAQADALERGEDVSRRHGKYKPKRPPRCKWAKHCYHLVGIGLRDRCCWCGYYRGN